MLEKFNKRKNYIVRIISKGKREDVQVIAENRKKATQMVMDILLNCNIFGFKSKNEFKLKCLRSYRRC